MAKTKQDVLRTAQKLANLTEANGATPGEAAVAAEKLQQLLIDHNLEIAEILNSPDQTKRPKIIMLRFPLAKIDNTIKWQREFIFGVARYTFCKAISHGNRCTEFSLIGRESDVRATKEMIDYLFMTLQQIAADTFEREGTGNPVKWKTGFYWGASQMIIRRLYEQWQKARLQPNTSMTAIVVTTDKDIKEFVVNRFGNLNTFNQGRASQGNLGGKLSGIQAGKNIPLGPPTKLSSGSKALKA